MPESDVLEQLAEYFAWIESGSDLSLSPGLVEPEPETQLDLDSQDSQNPAGRKRWRTPLLLVAAVLVVMGAVWSLFGRANQPERLRIVDEQQDDSFLQMPEDEQRKRLAPFGVPDSSDFSLVSYELLPTASITRSVSVYQWRLQLFGSPDSYADLVVSVVNSDEVVSIDQELVGPTIDGVETWVSREDDWAAIRWLPNNAEMIEIASRDLSLAELIEFARQPGIASGEIDPPEGTTEILTGIGRTYPDRSEGATVLLSSGYQSNLEAADSTPVKAAMFRGDPLAELVTYSTLFPTSAVSLLRTPNASEAAIIAIDEASNLKYLVWEEEPNTVFDGRSAPNGIVGMIEADLSVSDEVLIELVEAMVPVPLPGFDTDGLSESARVEVDQLELDGNLVAGVRSEPAGSDIVYLTANLAEACVRVLGVEEQPDVCLPIVRSRPGAAKFIRSIRDDIAGGERSILIVGQSHGATFEGVAFSEPPWSVTRRGFRIDILSTYEDGAVELVPMGDDQAVSSIVVLE